MSGAEPGAGHGAEHGAEPLPEPTESAGFEVFEEIVAEAVRNQGKSPTVDGWVAEARKRLDEAREARLGARDGRAAARIQAAYEEAQALLSRCLERRSEGNEEP